MTPEGGQPQIKQPRYRQLDALRGLAAMVVVIEHHFGPLGRVFNAMHYRPVEPALLPIFYPPLSLLWSGHAAVLLFFVLSGFVLIQPYLRAAAVPGVRPPTYAGFLVRRFLRIYVPYVIAIGGAMALACVVPPVHAPGLAPMFYGYVWPQHLSLRVLLQHLLMLGPFDYDIYNGVIWTLVIEARVALFFPLIAAFVIRRNAWMSLALTAACLLIGAAGTHRFLAGGAAYAGAYTIYYTSFFVAGALIAKHSAALVRAVNHLPRKASIPLLIFALLLCSLDMADIPRHLMPGIIMSPLGGLGVSILIVMSLTTLWMFNPVALFLGRISYSRYLWHGTVILVYFHLAFGRMPLPLLIALSGITSLVVGTVTYWLIERPAHEAARKAGHWLDGAPPTVSQ